MIEAGGLVRGSDRASRIDWVIRQCRLLGRVGVESCVVPVPRSIDEQVARSSVELANRRTIPA